MCQKRKMTNRNALKRNGKIQEKLDRQQRSNSSTELTDINSQSSNDHSYPSLLTHLQTLLSRKLTEISKLAQESFITLITPSTQIKQPPCHSFGQTLLTEKTNVNHVEDNAYNCNSIPEETKTHKFEAYAILTLIVCVTYCNGLTGDFVFDDLRAIVNNPDVNTELRNQLIIKRPSHHLYVPMQDGTLDLSWPNLNLKSPHLKMPSPSKNEKFPMVKQLWNFFIRLADSSWIGVWKHDYWGADIRSASSHKSYRPLTTYTFKLNYIFSGLNPIPFHTFNIVIHLGCTLLFYRLLGIITKRGQSKNNRLLTLFPAILFAVHPIHVDAVTSIVGRSELLSCFFFLLALTCYISHPGKLKKSCFLAICSMLSKEQGLSVFAILIIMDIILKMSPKGDSKLVYKRWISTIKIAFVFILTLVVRLWIMEFKTPIFYKFDNPAAYAPSTSRTLTFTYLGWLNFWKLLYPQFLSCDWSMQSIGLINQILDIRNIFSCAFYTILMNVVIKYTKCYLTTINLKRSHEAVHIYETFAFLLMIVPFIPASNLFYSVGFVLAERVLYIPSLGFCMLIARGLINIPKLSNKSKGCLIIGLTTILMVRTIVRNKDWDSQYLLMKSAVRVVPLNAKPWENLALWYEEKGNLPMAYQHFRKATNLQPNDVEAWTGKARVECKQEKFEECKETYEHAIKVLRQELSTITFNSSNLQSVIPITWFSLFTTVGDLYTNLIFVNGKHNHDTKYWHQALELYEEGFKWTPSEIKPYLKAANILYELKRNSDANLYLSKALLIGKSSSQNLPDILFEVASNKFTDQDFSLKMLQKAVIQNPCHIPSLMRLFNIHLNAKQDTPKSLQYKESGSAYLKTIVKCLTTTYPTEFKESNEILAHAYYLLSQISMQRATAYADPVKTAVFHADAYKYASLSLRHNPKHSGSLLNLALLFKDANRNLISNPHIELSLESRGLNTPDLTTLYNDGHKAQRQIQRSSGTKDWKGTLLSRAKYYVDLLLHWYPRHIKGLLLSGDIYYRDLGEPGKALGDYNTAIGLLAPSVYSITPSIVSSDENYLFDTQSNTNEKISAISSDNSINKFSRRNINKHSYTDFFLARHNVCLIYLETGQLSDARNCITTLQNDTLSLPALNGFSRIVGISAQRLDRVLISGITS